MAMPTEPNAIWTDWQNDLLVADYFDMFGRWKAGEKINRLERNRELQSLTQKKKGSIERKRQNVSGVLHLLDMEWMKGFAPNTHFQRNLVDAVQRYLDRHPEWLDDSKSVDIAGYATALIEIQPPPLGQPQPPPSAPLERIARKYNRAERDFQNRRLGQLGEELVFKREKNRLSQAGLPKLAEKVEWTSQERGDGVGYDILSFEADGSPKKIEVKTTNGPPETPFFLTRTEYEVSNEDPNTWHLYRVYNLSITPGLFKIRPPIEDAVHLSIETWRATF